MKKIICLILIFMLVISWAGLRQTSAAPATHLVISEIQTTGGTGYTTDEFAELYNPTDSDVMLAGWKLTKKTATGKEYVLVDNFGEKVIKTHSFFLVAHPTGYSGKSQLDIYYTTTNSISDNNTVILYDAAGQVIDRIGFGSTTDFEGEAMANPGAKKSVERKAKLESTAETMIEGGNDYFLGNAEDTDNNKQDFILINSPEPQNSFSEQEYLTIDVPKTPLPPSDSDVPKTDEQKQEENTVYSNKIIISEFFPNPKGSDDSEFIELKNIGEADVDLNGWKLGDNSQRKFIIGQDNFKSTVIPAGGFFVVQKQISKISLNNTSDAAKLYQPNDNLLGMVEYKTCQEGQSYNLINGQWVWSDEVTPGKENILKINNNPPEAEMNSPKEAKVRQEIAFDASESSDADADKIQYFWDFDDGQSGQGEEIKHIYQKASEYKVVLKVVDAKGGEDKAEQKIKITDYDYSNKIVINELLPAPEGDDKELEWIEIFNPEKRDINLEAWQITDLKANYQLPANKIIKANNYLVIKRKESKIALNDSGDKLFLIDPNGRIINGVAYQSAKKDLAFAKNNNHWEWIEKPTPGQKNEFVISDESESTDETSVKNEEKTVVNTTPIELKMADVNESYLKKLVTITGAVDRTSGNNIYLTDEDGSNLRAYIQASTGIKKPELKQGDKLKITGVLDKTTAGLRLLPRVESDLEIQKTGQVLGASTEKEATPTPTGEKNNQIKLYLIVAGGALLVVLAGLGVKYYFKTKQ